MKTAAVRVLALLGVLLWQFTAALAADTGPAATGPKAAARDLLAQGGDNRFWIARVQPASGDNEEYEQTTLMYRQAFGQPWAPVAPVACRVVSLASNRGELLLVLDNGQWEIADPSAIRGGPPAPQGDDMLAIAADGDSVWAVVRANPATRPSGAATLPATAPTTVPAQLPLLAVQFSAGEWGDACPLPAGVQDDPGQMSLAVLGQLPLLAWRSGDGFIYLSRLTAKKTWSPPVRAAHSEADFKLLTTIQNQAGPVLWLASSQAGAARAASHPETAGQLLWGDHFSQHKTLVFSGPAPREVTAQTVAVAFGRLRWEAIARDQPLEQAYSIEVDKFGEPADEVKPLASPGAQIIPFKPWLWAAVALVAGAIAAAVRQRRWARRQTFPGQRQLQACLATPGLRFAAGLVDLLPLLAVVALVHPAGADNLLAGIDQTSLQNLGLLATATYILHILAAEMICGQSLGKMIFGLRVIGSDGNAPKPVALLTRNLLRILDVALMFMPLLLILFSPLRQRVGDVAAKTVVIATQGEAAEEDQD